MTHRPPVTRPRRRFLVVAGATALGAGLGGWPLFAQPRPLTVAAAADLQAVLPALLSRFEAQSGRRCQVTYGSSGHFFAQLQHGAPFDVFFSADAEYPQRLMAAGQADAATLTPYAVGRLALWARRDRRLDLAGGLAVLATPAVRRVAIANPAHAPYGRAAMAALDHAGITAQVRNKLVFGENVAQAAQFARSGNADAGLIALALARSPGLAEDGVHVAVPAAFHPPLLQAAVALRASKQAAAARTLLAFVVTPEARALFTDAGFDQPAGAAR